MIRETHMTVFNTCSFNFVLCMFGKEMTMQMIKKTWYICLTMTSHTHYWKTACNVWQYHSVELLAFEYRCISDEQF